MAIYALLDGGICMAEYLWANGIRPSHILFKVSDLEEALTYCDPETDIVLCIVNGCTTFSMAALKNLIRFLVSCDTISEAVVFSNIPIHIPSSDFPYILYDGDLFAGNEYNVNVKNEVKSIAKLKPVPKSRKRITNFKVTEATLDDVDIGEVPKHYIENPPDSVKRSDIIQVNVFNEGK